MIFARTRRGSGELGSGIRNSFILGHCDTDLSLNSQGFMCKGNMILRLHISKFRPNAPHSYNT
jgi:hypothetical protein